MNTSTTIALICGGLCCVVPLLGMFFVGRLRGFGVILPLIGVVGLTVRNFIDGLLSRGDDDPKPSEKLGEVRRRVPTARDLRAQAQSMQFDGAAQAAPPEHVAQQAGHDDFESQIAPQFTPQNDPYGTIGDPHNPPPTGNPGWPNKSEYAVRQDDNNPNRVVQNRRYDRNDSGVSLPDANTPPMPRPQAPPQTNRPNRSRFPDPNISLDGAPARPEQPPGQAANPDDLFGDAGLPGLRQNPRRPYRDQRGGRERWDDEIFGGMLDDEGDGYADY